MLLEFSYTSIILLSAYLIRIAYWFFSWRRTTAHIPCYGLPGLKGYFLTALKYTFDSVECMKAACAEFPHRPFFMPTLINGPILVVGSDYIDFLRTSTDRVFSANAARYEMNQLNWTLDPHQLKNPYGIGVLQRETSKELDKYLPGIVGEIELTLDDGLRTSNVADDVEIDLFPSMTDMIARIVNRTLVGQELCRNTRYRRAVVHYASTFVFYSMVLKLFPDFMKALVYNVLSIMFGGKREPAKHLLTFLKNYTSSGEEENPTMIAALLKESGQSDPQQLVMPLIALNFGSIHTTSIVCTQTLFELAVMSPSDVKLIRDEIEEVFSRHNGEWTKSALSSCLRLDSLLREIGRLYGVTIFSSERYTIQDGILPGKVIVPRGTMLSVPNLTVHMDPKIYPDPEKFDAFRFYDFKKNTNADGKEPKHDLTTIDSNHYLLFGLGRHACAGRYFAAAVIKLVVIYVLRHYDVRLPKCYKERPQNLIFNGVIVPDRKGRLQFVRR
ncbi:cytochrome P450 [Dendrothele bispora CBS 962.96]|uniref:Cytochrome P450 n=1 Tax=Dendrothele bispora (strain CBS 962.96) TaxID=1314807 RepID=A0A4S8LJ88_DENBC|nr:cytochrome P450 [Dendrothele bispora CBS 962.96]